MSARTVNATDSLKD